LTPNGRDAHLWQLKGLIILWMVRTKSLVWNNHLEPVTRNFVALRKLCHYQCVYTCKCCQIFFGIYFTVTIMWGVLSYLVNKVSGVFITAQKLNCSVFNDLGSPPITVPFYSSCILDLVPIWGIFVLFVRGLRVYIKDISPLWWFTHVWALWTYLAWGSYSYL
jgi:hypothetical protein